MNELAVYDGNLGIFNFNVERLSKAGIELNVLRSNNLDNPASQITLDLLIFKALSLYFREEKVISFDAIDCYFGVLKKSSRIIEKIKEKDHFLPFPINPRGFSQDEILELYTEERFNSLLGMLSFVDRMSRKKFEKIKKIY